MSHPDRESQLTRIHPLARLQAHGRWTRRIVLALLLLGAVAVPELRPTRQAEAQTTHNVTLVASGGDFALTGSTFDAVVTALEGNSSPSIDVAIPGLETLSTLPMEVVWNGTTHVITMLPTAPTTPFLGGSPLSGVPVSVALVVRWADAGSDTTPEIALAIAVVDLDLSSLFPGWDGIPGVTDTTRLAEAVVVLTPTVGMTLDPAELPAAINNLLGVDGALAETLVLSEVSSLLGRLDLGSNAAFAAVAEFFGFDPNEAIVLAGTLADSAATLFNSAAEFNEDDFSLDGPFEIDSNSLPPWLERATGGMDLPEFRLRIGPAPDHTPSVNVHDTVVIHAGGVDNVVEYDVSLADASDLEIHVGIPSLNVPYGLEALGTLTDAELALSYDDTTQEFAATLDARLMIGSASQQLHVQVNNNPADTRALVAVDGSIPIGDLVTWLAGTDRPFADGDFDPLDFASATLDQVEFSYDSSANQRVLGLYGDIDGIDVFNDSVLRVRLLLGVDQPLPGGAPKVLVGLRVDEPGCNDGACISLSEVLPIPGGTLGADIEMPAVSLVVMRPDGAQFTTSKLGPAAVDFLEELIGNPPPDPFVITGDLNLIADVPLGVLDDLLAGVGIETSAPTVHVVGSAGFSLEVLDGDPGPVVLEEFHLEGTLSGIDGLAPPGFPSWMTWPNTEAWRLTLDFDEGDPLAETDDTIAIGAVISGITSDVFPALPPVDLAAKFSGSPASQLTTWKFEARASFQDWVAPFGLTFLTVEEGYAELTIERASGNTTAGAELCGLFDIGGVDFRICAEIVSLGGPDGPEATFRVDLITPVTLDQALAALPGGLLANVQLPAGIGGNSIGPGTIEFQVNGEGEFTVGVVAEINAQAFGFQLPFELMLTGAVGGQQSFGALGLKLQPGASLGSLIGQPDLPVNLPLSPPAPPPGQEAVGGFAFVFSTGSLAFDSAQLPESVESWFRPLYGGDLGGQELGGVAGVVGALALPEPLAGFVSQMGMDPNVLVHGSLGFDPIAVELGMTLRLRDGILPEFIDGVELELSVGFEVSPAPALVFSLEGSMYLKFKQGMDAGLADQLQSIGVNLPAALPVNPGDACPRGGFNLPTTEEDGSVNNYCYDKLKVFVGTELGVTVAPPEVSLRAFGGMVTQNTGPGATWSPLGIEEIGIGSLGAEVEISFAAGPPLSLNLKLGLYGDITILDYDVSAGIKVGVSIVSAPTPIGIAATPNFDGLRISLPDGLETNGIIDVANTLAEAVGAPMLPYPDPATFPNIALKNLYLSISPLGASSVCIEQGLIFRGDLYINPTPGLDFTGGPPCDPTFDPPVGYSIDPDETCANMKDEGCVASVLFSLTPSGLIAEGFIAGFDLDPFPMRSEDMELSLRLTLTEQRILLRGGVEIGPEADPWAEGHIFVLVEPTALQFAGQLQVLGFNALVDGRLSVLDVLKGTADENDPGLGSFEFHVVLAAPELALPEYETTNPDFASSIADDLEAKLTALEDTITFFVEVMGDFGSDPLGTLLDLPGRLGFSGPATAWLADLKTEYDNAVAALEAVGATPEFDLYDLLNGFSTPPVYGVEVDTPVGTACWPGFEGDPCVMIPGLTFFSVCNSVIPGAGTECTQEEVEAAIEAMFYAPIEAILDTINVEGDDALDRILEGLSGPGGATLFGLQCAAFSIELAALGENSADIAFDATFFGQDVNLFFSWDFNDPIGSALALLENYLSGTAGGTCVGVDQDLFGPGGLGNPDSHVEELPPLRISVSAGAKSIDEGSPITATVTFNRPVDASDGSRTVVVDWGDGSTGSVTFAVGEKTKVVGPHVYSDDNPTVTSSDLYTITATDTGAGGSSDSVNVRVRNVAPSGVTLQLDASAIDENDVVELTVSWADPGTDTFTIRITWGDGVVEEVKPPAGDRAVTATHRYPDDSPTGTPGPDPVTINVRVRDDDGGQAFGSAALTVSNVLPDANSVVLSPVSVDEGDLVTFTVTFTDVGSLDTHVVAVDWYGDGTIDAYGQVGTSRTLVVEKLFLDDDPSGTPYDDIPVRILVADDDLGAIQVTRMLRINNVPPAVCFALNAAAPPPGREACPVATATISEGGTLTVRGTFDDPGLPDTHTIVVDWGHADLGTTVLTPDAGTRAFEASKVYGDNGTFSITVTVTDDDTGLGTATGTVVVNNVNPAVALDETPAVPGPGAAGTVLADGSEAKDNGVLDEPTFVTRAEAATTLSAHATDPGSDDLTFNWIWGDTLSSVVTSLVNPPAMDPLPSPTLQPRDFVTTAAHAWAKACLYQVVLNVLDDDAGTATDDTWVVVTGTERRIWAPGYWYNQYDLTKKSQNRLAEETLECYRRIVNHMSRVFGDGPTGRYWQVSSFTDMRDGLNTKKTSDDGEIMQRQLLAAWLNFANGSVTWFGLVDTNRDGIGDTPFHVLMAESEALRLNPAATRAELLAQEDKLKSANND